MEYLIKVFVSILGFIGSNHISLFGVDIPLVNKGSGLYEDRNNSYIYKGNNPNNYIKFNNELWRIISIDNGAIKIVKNDSVGNMVFDKDDSNEWKESSLYEYLNNDYYDTLGSEYKKIVNGDIQIMSMEDYIEANSNLNLCSSLDLYFKNDEKCFKTNYINNIIKDDAAWTLTKEEDTVFYVGNTYFNDIRPFDYGFGVLPVLYLNKNIELYGKGTLQNPYKIEF